MTACGEHGGGLDDAPDALPVERETDAVELALPTTVGDLDAIASGHGTLVVASVNLGKVTTTTTSDGGATWDQEVLRPDELVLRVALGSSSRGVLMMLILCPARQLNYEDGCESGAAALSLLRLDGERWRELSRTPAPDLAIAEFNLELVSGEPGTLAVYDSQRTYSDTAVVFGADGRVEARAEIAGVASVICPRETDFLLRTLADPGDGVSAIAGESGETVISSAGVGPSGWRLVALTGSGEVTTPGRATSAPAFCSDGSMIGIGEDGSLTVEGGDGEALGRLDPVTGPALPAVGDSGNSGLVFAGIGEEETRVKVVWATAKSVKQYGWSSPGVFQPVVAAVDGDKLFLAYGSTEDPAGTSTIHVRVIG